MTQFFQHYRDVEHLLVSSQLVLVMLAMGGALRLSDFRAVLARPALLGHGMICLWLVAPLVAVGLGLALPLPAGIGFGLLLVAVLPGGALSNLMTCIGRGNIALSISLTVVATLAALVAAPLLLELLGGDLVPGGLRMPVGRMVGEIVLFLLLPLIAGMTLGSYRPEWRKPLERWGVRFGMTLLGLVIVGSLGSGRIHPLDYGWPIALTIVAFCVFLEVSSMGSCRVLQRTKQDRLAIGVEVTVRNVNLGVLLVTILFPPTAQPDPIADAVLFVVLFYGATSLCAGMATVLLHRRWIGADEKRQAGEAVPLGTRIASV